MTTVTTVTFHDDDEASKPVWRIIWMMTDDGEWGYVDSFMTYKDAKEIATKKNMKHGDQMSYWVQHKNEPLPENRKK